MEDQLCRLQLSAMPRTRTRRGGRSVRSAHSLVALVSRYQIVNDVL